MANYKRRLRNKLKNMKGFKVTNLILDSYQYLAEHRTGIIEIDEIEVKFGMLEIGNNHHAEHFIDALKKYDKDNDESFLYFISNDLNCDNSIRIKYEDTFGNLYVQIWAIDELCDSLNG